VSETGLQLSDVSVTGVQSSDVSDCAVQVSAVSDTAPQPKPIIVPTEPDASTPIIAIDKAFVTLSIEEVAEFPDMAMKVITSAPIVPTEPVATFPVIDFDLVPTTEPADRVD